jgi:hypothetical protein
MILNILCDDPYDAEHTAPIGRSVQAQPSNTSIESISLSPFLRVAEKGARRRTIGLHFNAAEAIQDYIAKARLSSGPTRTRAA